MASKTTEVATIVNMNTAPIVYPDQMKDSEIDLPEALREYIEYEAPEGLTPVVTFPEEGALFIGEYIGLRENIGPNNSRLYDFRVPSPREAGKVEVVSIWGSTILDDRFNRMEVNPKGKLVGVQYTGTVETSRKQNPAKTWKVVVFRDSLASRLG